MNKLLVICGSTATGKTNLAIKLAKIYHGELVNADSRQVYKGMDIGTGKDIEQKSKFKNQNAKLQFKNKNLTIGYRKKEGIPIWLVDICDPDYNFNLGDYQRLALQVITDIQNRGKLPIVVGGTGLYIRSLLSPLDQIQIPPNMILRQQLNNQAIDQLKDQLIKLDQKKFKRMNHSDQNNPRRLIRAIEIAKYQEDCHAKSNLARNDNNAGIMTPLPTGENLVIGLKLESKILADKISQRVAKRVNMGIIEEIKNLLNLGFSWDLPSMSAIGYKEWESFFEMQKSKIKMQNYSLKIKLLKSNILNLWQLHEKQYAKRQMTYIKKLNSIIWFDAQKEQEKLLQTVNLWYNKKYTHSVISSSMLHRARNLV